MKLVIVLALVCSISVTLVLHCHLDNYYRGGHGPCSTGNRQYGHEAVRSVPLQREEVHLVIAVLSARDHFGLRQSVRDTWLSGFRRETRYDRGLQVDFVVGRHACLIPEELRQNPFSCEPHQYEHLKNVPPSVAVGGVDQLPLPRKGISETNIPEPLGIDFEFQEEAVITHLGVYDHMQDGIHGRIAVYICDSVSGKVIVETTISSDDTNLQRQGLFVYKPVPAYGFAKSFLGSAVAGNFSKQDPALIVKHGDTGLHEPSSLMQLQRQSRHGGMVGKLPVMVENVLPAPRYMAASFIYMPHPHAATDASMDTVSRTQLEESYEGKLKNEDHLLQREVAEHRDVTLLDLVDTYRNLPRKLLLYFEFIVKRGRFDYLLKTDDDCLLNVSAVLAGLSEMGPLQKVWWGRFRRDWQVERFGKWRELLYAGKVYPPFACGVGHILSEDLIIWLAENQQHLHAYQGEDVSLGIWLLSVGPRHWDDERWVCSTDYFQKSGNLSHFLAVPNLEVDEMKKLWQLASPSGNA